MKFIPRSKLLVAFLLFIASLTLYLATLAPSVVTMFDDSLEFQLVTYQLGIAHPTGYPLFTILGKLFTLLPVGNVAYRVNLMSAFFGAVTVALLYLLIEQAYQPGKEREAAVTGPSWPVDLAAAVAALLFATGLVFWQQATIAEVYTLNAFFVALLLLLVLTLPPTQKSIFVLAFLAGLSLSHHRTMVLLFPALGLYLLLGVKRDILFKAGTVLGSLGLFLLPLLLYLYLPLRGHIGSLDGTYQNSWSGFWQQVTASGYGLFIVDNPFSQTRDATFYWNLLGEPFALFVLSLIGLVYLIRLGRRPVLGLTGLAYLTYLAFNHFYNVSDIEVFFIPNRLISAVWSGLGAAFLLQSAAALKPPLWRYGAVGGLCLIFAILMIRPLANHQAHISEKYSWQVHDYGLDILQQPLEDEAAIVGILGEMTLLRYFQQTEQRQPHMKTIAADAETERLAAVESLLAAGQTPYLTRQLPGAAERWSLNALGPLIRVNAQPVMSTPKMDYPLPETVTPEISLLGYDINTVPHTDPGPAPVRLTLYWQANAPIAADLKVSARLLDPSGEIQAVTDAIPVHFTYPTPAWRNGEIVSDVYDLALPADAAGGAYTPLIIWYDPAQNAAEVGRITLPAVVVE